MLPGAVLEFSRWQCVILSDSLRAAAAVLCHREMQDQIRPWLMWLKWTQRCQRKVAENWLLETDSTQLVKKVHLLLWLLVNGCEGLHFFALGKWWCLECFDHVNNWAIYFIGGRWSLVFKLSPLLPEQAVQPLSSRLILRDVSKQVRVMRKLHPSLAKKIIIV